jgi:hypothetical protein
VRQRRRVSGRDENEKKENEEVCIYIRRVVVVVVSSTIFTFSLSLSRVVGVG